MEGEGQLGVERKGVVEVGRVGRSEGEKEEGNEADGKWKSKG